MSGILIGTIIAFVIFIYLSFITVGAIIKLVFGILALLVAIAFFMAARKLFKERNKK